MSIPKDGYYIARVQLDTGGEHQRYVRVKGGKLHDEEGEELLPQACGDFNELSSVMIAWVWPEDVAMELEALRTANAGLVEKIKEMEAARTQAAANSIANMLSYEEVVERMKRLDARYQSLIMLVATKHPTETRHDTAARYIREREGLQPLPASEGKILPCGVKSSVAKGQP